MPACPLCDCSESRFVHEQYSRLFYHCRNCKLIFVPPEFFLSEQEELAHYSTHQNSPDDVNYRKFLSKLSTPMLSRLSPKSHGLDFGSGPGPTLSVMFEEAGHSMEIYDCFYAKDPHVFDLQYDFISASEVFEHLHRPKYELQRLLSILKPNAILGVMTMTPPRLSDLEHWHYLKDPTHVCFYSPETFIWIAETYTLQLNVVGDNLAIFQNI